MLLFYHPCSFPNIDLDNKTLLFGPDTTRRATTDALYPWSPAVIGDEARSNAVNFGAVFLNLTESNHVAIPLLNGKTIVPMW